MLTSFRTSAIHLLLGRPPDIQDGVGADRLKDSERSSSTLKLSIGFPDSIYPWEYIPSQCKRRTRQRISYAMRLT